MPVSRWLYCARFSFWAPLKQCEALEWQFFRDTVTDDYDNNAIESVIFYNLFLILSLNNHTLPRITDYHLNVMKLGSSKIDALFILSFLDFQISENKN